MKFEELGVGEIMMMPDHVFGRRWWITAAWEGGLGFTWGKSHEPLPEYGVVWGVKFYSPWSESVLTIVTLRFGDQLPLVAATFEAMELAFSEIAASPALLSSALTVGTTGGLWFPMRKPVAGSGRCVVAQALQSGADAIAHQVGVLVSSFPRGGVPGWLL